MKHRDWGQYLPFNRKGASTVEYVMILAAILVSALLLSNFMANDGQAMIKDKIMAIINGDLTGDTANGGGTDSQSGNDAKQPSSDIPQPKELATSPNVKPKKEQGKTQKYDRKKAVDYARKWSHKINTDKYEEMGETVDCANFVSQCLVESGFEMNDDWKYKKGFTIPLLDWTIGSDYEHTWTVAHDQFKYFSNKKNGYSEGDPIKITSPKQLRELEKKGIIKEGDLLYWDWEGDKKINHATIITDTKDGELKFSGHSNSRRDTNVYDTFENVRDDQETKDTVIYIVRMKDRVPAKGGKR
ncbi:amidase domain-containing protein [Kroppenstedtia eburnea]|uniref:Putative amidase domain-containing protein n=1 Tax=Kroppenstedtia eburnea TaxID=714067 RepID=A0A1N7MWR7_9BACL|nr:amidase domain-containing protein [Kroppenstedtia eburnea]QKI80705.1 hypothetical protein GXN75_01000 [Kroppenstedtia eburnea]SIS90536.1 Putative amidase domain-containing protein [Kroppenstedtia eburnea]